MDIDEFRKFIMKLESECLSFSMEAEDYEDLFDYVIARKNIKYLKKHFINQQMNYFDMVGLEVEFLNLQMAKITKINHPEVKILKCGDVVININNKADFFHIDDKAKNLMIRAIRGYCEAECLLVEEILPYPIITSDILEIESMIFPDIMYGIIRLYDCNFSVSKIEKKLIEFTNAGVKVLLFDLRNNKGGSVKRTSKLLDLLLEDESIKFYYMDKHMKLLCQKVCNQNAYRFDEIIVLVNNCTISAAEIFTAALKENINAIVIGEKTAGKGTIISPMNINEYSYIMYPKYEYFTPQKNKVESKGIYPDYNFNKANTILPDQVRLLL